MTNFEKEVQMILDAGFTVEFKRNEEGTPIAIFDGKASQVVTEEQFEKFTSNETTEVVATVPEGQRFVTLETFNEYEGLEVGQVVSTGKRTRTIKEIKKVLTDQGVKEIWIYTESPSGIKNIVGLETAKKYKVIG